MAELTVEIVTPEKLLYSQGGVTLLSVPGAKGQLGILPSHAALLTTLDPGEIRIVRADGQEEVMAVTGGFLEVRQDKAVVLAETAERADEIDIARADAARRRAEERLMTREAGIDLARAEAAMARSLIRLRVAERMRRRLRRPPPSGMSPEA